MELVEQSDIIAIEPMDEAHALALFEKKLGKQGESQDVAELAAALEFMPLAIVQAAAYISQRAPRCSVRQYLEEFQKSDRKKTSLLNYEGGQLRRDREAKNSIIITWQISFDYIRQTRLSAADLLSLMSFFLTVKGFQRPCFEIEPNRETPGKLKEGAVGRMMRMTTKTADHNLA